MILSIAIGIVLGYFILALLPEIFRLFGFLFQMALVLIPIGFIALMVTA